MRYWQWKIVTKLFVLLLIFNTSNAQNINEKPFKLFSKSEKIEIDQYGFIYHINKDNLVKFSKEGVPLYNYSNKLLGNITQLDISNPLRPLLFYKDQGIILALDNTLSLQKSEISLNRLYSNLFDCCIDNRFHLPNFVIELVLLTILLLDYLVQFLKLYYR